MVKGLIVIDQERCKGCGLCLEVCSPKLIEVADFLNGQGYRPAVFKNTDEKCTGCSLCAVICPDVAVEVYREVRDGQKSLDEG